MKSRREVEVEKALSKARDAATKLERVAERLPPLDAQYLMRAANSTVTNLAMALGVLQRQRGANGGQSIQG